MYRFKRLVNEHAEVAIIAALLLVAVFAHGINFFDFPYYENDEAVYMSQAWAVSNQGELAPYTYWYDHAPAGWILIAIWAKLTGGYFTFGPAVNSGRVLMLLLSAVSTFLIYFITRQLTKARLPAIVAALVFALSPLSIYFGRRVLLDNIMVFWSLVAAALLLLDRVKLRHVFLSATAFALAALSKESAAFFLPAFVFLVWQKVDRRHWLFAMASWLTLAGAIIALYPLSALIQSELFPTGTLLGGSKEHVSLLGTLKYQADRPGGSIFTPENSLFWLNVRKWFQVDAFLMWAGAIGTAFIGLLSFFKRQRSYLFIVFLNVFMIFFLARGGVVIEFYVIPLLATFAITIGIAAYEVVRLLRIDRTRIGYGTAAVLLVCILTGSYVLGNNNYQGLDLFTANQTAPEIAALNWIRQNADPDDVIVTDNYLWLDLNAPENPSGKVFPNAEWYWKVEQDKEISQGLLGGSPQKIDYLIITPQVESDLTSGFKIIPAALEESQPIVQFDNDSWSVTIWGHRTPDKMVDRAWHSYRHNFINSNGAVKDPATPTTFTSKAQADALLRAAWMNDEETFSTVLLWTRTNLETSDHLFRSQYSTTGSVAKSTESNSGSDEDIALALIFASRQFNNSTYADLAHTLLSAIWQKEVTAAGNNIYLAAGDWANYDSAIVLNPSYFAPASYRIFAEFDPTHPWQKLVDSSYLALERCTFNSLSGTPGVLPPDWCELNKTTGSFTATEAPAPISKDYSHDASSIPSRIALDYTWNASPAAKNYLSQLSFLGAEYSKNGNLFASYQHNGAVRDQYNSVATAAGSFGYFLVVKPELTKDYYEKTIQQEFYENVSASYWQDPNNLYTQSQTWFATALYADRLPNLWTATSTAK
jgi:endo-1,4-beta-D-glucanase Y/4-amino-4-deoxy-L-arabinose transferase-like glycosyltransferase